MRLRAGSFGWLVAHDLRLSWRRFLSMFGSLRPLTVAAVVAVGAFSLHALAWPVANWLAEPGETQLVAMAGVLVFVFSWLISQSLTNATRALFSRGDLDLLIASPLPAGRLLAARALAIAVECLSGVGMLILPVANMMALQGAWNGLAFYPMLAASALLAAALGLTLAVGLFMLVGPRRTRLVSQILATLIGAAFVLGLQAANILPESIRANFFARLQAAQPGTIYDPANPLWLPVRAAFGSLPDLGLWVAVSVLVFGLVSVFCGEAFVRSALRSAGAAAQPESPLRSCRRHERAARFRAGVGPALRRKEWRLLARDPYLVSQIFLQVVYTLPISVILWRSQGPDGSLALSVAPAIVVISSQISASLSWLTISSEDAPDFIGTAPVTRAQVERRKLEAVALPLGLFLAIPLIGLTFDSFELAGVTLVFAAGAALSTGLLNLWNPMPGRRGDLLRRHSQSKLVALMEHMLSLLWAVAMVLAVFGTYLTLIPLGIVAFLLWLNRPRKIVAGTGTARLRPKNV